MRRFAFNSKITPTREDLTCVQKGRNESFEAQGWRTKPAQVQPQLDEDELMHLFLKTLPYKYFDKMFTSGCQSFSHLVEVGKRVEWGIRNGWLTKKGSSIGGLSQANKSPAQKVKGMSYHQEFEPRSRDKLGKLKLHQSSPSPQSPLALYPGASQGDQSKKTKQLAPLPKPLSQLLPALLAKSLVAKEVTHNTLTRYAGFDPSKSYIYHL